jgi:ribosome-associated toxin RatA of RatAB toxin-antitoxin module
MKLRTLVTPVLALALALAPIAASADSKSDIEKLAQSKQSKRYNVASPGTSIRTGGAKIVVNAPLKTVESIVTRYSRYSKIMPRFQKSRVVAKKKGVSDVYFEVPILHGAAKVWSLTRFGKATSSGKNRLIEGKMLDGNVRDLRARWRLQPLDSKRTLVNMEILIVPKLPVPGSVVTGELEFAADQAVTAVRDHAEARVKSHKATAKK